MSQLQRSARPVRRRGRPPAASSETTERDLLDSARSLFAQQGFDATALSAVASAAGLTPTAIYHYFSDKHALYAAVVRETLETVWRGLLDSVESETSLATQVEAFLTAADRYGKDRRLYSAFLIGIAVEARRHPEFEPLLEELSAWQTDVFDVMAVTGRETGELDTFESTAAASQALRLILLGWSYETHYQPSLRQPRADAVRAAVKGWSVRP